mgnify:CR=1 FL=1
MSDYKLTSEIIRLSKATEWNDARFEWDIEEIVKDNDPHTCLCGHFPIYELCTLRNIHNHNTALVGNCCVKKFMRLPSHKIFNAIARVQGDYSKPLNRDTIDHAYSKKWIDHYEYRFYTDTIRKRALSDNQKSMREAINKRIIDRIVKR